MNLKNLKVIVTGGAGVIGQELISRLLNIGCSVTCFDIAPKPSRLSQEVKYIQMDLASLAPQEFTHYYPDVVLHLAATFERTEENADFWESNFANNVIVSHNVINAAKECPSLGRFVFASSYLIYSPTLYLFKSQAPRSAHKLQETDKVNPRNICGAAKFYTERELEFCSNVAKLPFTNVSARIFRVYGLGSRDIISRWVRAGLNGETLTVFGENNSFDYIFAGDVAEGLLRLAQSDSSGVVNLATGNSTKIQEVVKCLTKEIPGLKIKNENKPSLTEKSAADVTELKKQTDWSPKITIEEGIGRLVSFEKSRLKN